MMKAIRPAATFVGTIALATLMTQGVANADALPTNPNPGSYGSYSGGFPVQGGGFTTSEILTEVTTHFDTYFPFTGCGPTLFVGKVCNLDTVVGGAPVEVVAIDGTGFALKSKPGHPEGQDRIITFSFAANDVAGNLSLVELQVNSFGPLSNSSLAGPLNEYAIARPAWTKFANNVTDHLPTSPSPVFFIQLPS